MILFIVLMTCVAGGMAIIAQVARALERPVPRNQNTEPSEIRMDPSIKYELDLIDYNWEILQTLVSGSQPVTVVSGSRPVTPADAPMLTIRKDSA